MKHFREKKRQPANSYISNIAVLNKRERFRHQTKQKWRRIVGDHAISTKTEVLGHKLRYENCRNDETSKQ